MGVLRNVVWCFEPDRPTKGHPHQSRIVSRSAPGFDSWRKLNENSKQQLTLLAARFGLAETNNFNPMHRHRGDVHLGSYRSGAQPGPASSLHRYNLESADPGWHMDGQLQFDLSARAQHGEDRHAERQSGIESAAWSQPLSSRRPGSHYRFQSRLHTKQRSPGELL